MIDTANIIMFPRGKRGRPPQTFEQVETNVASLRIYHIDEATRAVATALFDNMKGAGIDVRGMDKDIASVIEAIRSLLSAHYGIYHPFQKLMAEQFWISENRDIEPALIPPRRGTTNTGRPHT